MRRLVLAKLVILTGRHRGARLNLPEKTVVVGRDEDCAVRLNTHEVSRRHCTLLVNGDEIRVNDLESRNGTFINDVEVKEESILKPGDILRVGPMRFQMETQRPDLPEAPPEEFPSPTDDSITNWLAEDEPDPTESNDTAVMTTSNANEVTRKALIPTPGRDKFDSVAEEAADIIRRHQQWKEALAERGLELS
jgi:pSer/pThr/pTyr-binding forkhead associated (FHA) protein